MGSIYEKNGAFHWRTYSNVDIKTGQLLPENGNGKVLRKLQSVMLVRKDEGMHRTKGSPAVLQLATLKAEEIESWEHAAAMAAETGKRAPNGNMLVSEFYDHVFLPMMERRASTGIDAKVKHATVMTYRRYWSGYLRAHFNGSKTLRNYEPYMGSQFLEHLRKDDGTPFGINTVKKVHSVASKIFAIAVEEGYIKHNPWRDVKVGGKPAANAEKGTAFTEDQIKALLKNLEIRRANPPVGSRPSRANHNIRIAETALALGIWAGLRPSETIGLKWENVNLNEGKLLINTGVVYGKEKGTKTDVIRLVTMLSPAVPILREWHDYSGKPKSGFVFQNNKGGVIDLGDISDRTIWPVAEAMGLTEWKGTAFYGCRRGFGTLLMLKGASPTQIADAMGNTPDVVWRYYFNDNNKGTLAEQAARAYERSLDTTDVPAAKQLTAGAGRGEQ